MKLYFSILIIALLILNTLNCVSPADRNTITQESKFIIPLNVGNQWVYKTSYFDKNGKESLIRFDTVRVEGDTIINSIKISFLSTRRSDGVEYADKYFNLDSGLFITFFAESKFLHYKYPTKQLDSFQSNGFMKYIDSIDAIRIIKSETFKCIKYSSSFDKEKISFVHYEYVSPGIGLIFDEATTKYKLKDSISIMRKELIQFKVK